ncbi:hypothetical protein RUND412_011666, partial [Rhizina undulata]
SADDFRAFGPEGKVMFFEKGEHKERRRLAAFEGLEKLGPWETARVCEYVEDAF